MSEEKTRSVDKQIEIDATPEQVWSAISEAQGLKNWFPLDARVTPGVGGSIWLSWGANAEGTAEITVWEPNRHLQSLEGAGPHKMAVDYFIESAGGKTVLRLVHSGFSAAAEWDDEFQTITSGWRSFLFNLRHYLEHHPGTPRKLAYLRTISELSRPEAWQKLMGTAATAEGGSYEWQGYRGRVDVAAAPIHFAGSVDNLSKSYLFIEIEPRQTGCGPAAWLSTYGLPEDAVAREQEKLKAVFRDAGFV